MAKLNLSPPWATWYNEINEMFKYDQEVRIIYDEDNYIITLYIDNPVKADALMKILETEVSFGGVTLNINIIPSNRVVESKGNLFLDAFDGNDAFSYLQVIGGIFASDLTYVVFKNKVVQYFNDSLGDVNGLCSTLYQDIAKIIFKDLPNVYYCTDVEAAPGKSLGTPLGEWP